MARRYTRPSHTADVPASVTTPVQLLNVKGAAQWLGISRTKLFELMQEHDFPVIRLDKRTIRFDPNSLYAWSLTKQRESRIA